MRGGVSVGLDLWRPGAKLLDHVIEVGIAGAKATRDPVATTFGNLLAVGNHLKLTGLPGHEDGVDVEALLDQGHETRDLGFIVPSRRTVNDLDVHWVLQASDLSRIAHFGGCDAIEK
jgi:hypothetical protein